jgi:hypothetical protein
LANAIAALRHAPEWGGVLAFNEFGFGTVALKPAPWGVVRKGEWTDHEDRLATEWLQRQGTLVSVDVAGQRTSLGLSPKQAASEMPQQT